MHEPWLILRPEDEANALVASLAAHGVTARAAPAVERHTLSIPATVQARLHIAAEERQPLIVLLTSAYAAVAVARVALLARAIVGALAPSTARAAQEAGLNVRFTSTGGAVALAQECATLLRESGNQPGSLATDLFGEKRGESPASLVVHPTSDAGLEFSDDAPMRAALAPVAELLRFPLYETRANPLFGDCLAALRVPAARYVLTSPSAVAALAAVPHPTPVLALCRGVTTARAWDERFPDGPRAIVADRDAPLEAAILASDAR